MADDEITGSSTHLAARVRFERLHRGWDVCELERRSGVARTTLYHLEKGHTQRVRSSTVGALAKAFDLEVDQLVGLGNPSPAIVRERSAAFDRATNPAVADVARERPEVFEGWPAPT